MLVFCFLVVHKLGGLVVEGFSPLDVVGIDAYGRQQGGYLGIFTVEMSSRADSSFSVSVLDAMMFWFSE